MEDYMEIAYRYIIKQGKKSMFTLVTIIIAVALVTGVLLITQSLKNSDIEEARIKYGDYHMIIKGLDKKLLQEVSCYNGVEEKKITQEDYYDSYKEVYYEGYKEEEPHNIKSYNIYFTIKGLEEGRVSPEEFLKSIGENLGLELFVSNNEGTWINNEKAEINSRLVNEYFNLWSIDKSRKNNNSLIIVTIFILITIIIMITISNTFQITISQRIIQYGLLRSIGATPKQIEKIINREGFIISLVGSIIGVIVGYATTYIGASTIAKILMEGYRGFNIIINPSIVVISMFYGIVCTLIAIRTPCKLASKISTIEAVKGTIYIKESFAPKNKENNMYMRFLGIEGHMAYKNITRNRRKYLATISSIIVSISVFMAFYTVSKQGIDKEVLESKRIVDYKIKGRRNGIDDEFIQQISNIEGVDKVYKYIHQIISIETQEELLNGEVASTSRYYTEEENKGIDNTDKEYSEEYIDGLSVNNINSYNIDNVSIETYSRDNMEDCQEFLLDGIADYDKLLTEYGVLIVQNEYYENPSGSQNKNKIRKFQIGDSINIRGRKDKNTGNSYVQYSSVKVMGILKDTPITDMEESERFLKIICPEELYKQIIVQENYDVVNIITEDDANDMNIEMQLSNYCNKRQGFSFVTYLSFKEQKEIEVYIKTQKIVLFYGFIILVSTIAVLNIFNTIMTNVILRKNEISTMMSVGMSRRQVNKMIRIEGMIYAVVGVIGGIAIGTLVSLLLLIGTGSINKLSIQPLLFSAIVSIIVSSIVICVATYIPLRVIRKYNLSEGIKSIE
ncbi:MAG: ABC transporter permease [Clostridium sp.]